MNEEKRTIDIVRELIKKNATSHRRKINRSKAAERYYRNENDILYRSGPERDKSPLRNADNRIPRNFHGLLVNQKASYMFTAPPLFDVGNAPANKQIADALGDAYAKKCKDLCVNASNSSVAWLHYWVDDAAGFQYGVIDSKQVIPVFSSSLDKRLVAALRTYKDIDFKDGKAVSVWEYWDDKSCYSFKKKSDGLTDTGIEAYEIYQATLEDGTAKSGNVYSHGFGAVPFIPFYNNNVNTDDLVNIKPLIDAYDKVYSGFLNDLEDVQEIILILTNYGGTDLKEFIKDLKEYKAVKIDGGDEESGGGVEALTINIPIEARKEFLEVTRKAIFEQGQGVDPDPQTFGTASGVALKYLYSLLELKAGLMETEFKMGFGELVRAVCRHLGIECRQINQTWTRTAIQNETELAEIAAKSMGVVSQNTIRKNHPWVESAEEEEKQMEAEEAKRQERMNPYQQVFGQKAEQNENKLEGGEKDGEAN